MQISEIEKILNKDNLNRAFKRVKANKGAPGIDGMTVEETGDCLRENQKELIERIKRGKYTPDPVRRVEIPKPERGVRKLGIPTVKDRKMCIRDRAQRDQLYDEQGKLLLAGIVENNDVDAAINKYIENQKAAGLDKICLLYTSV